MLDLIVFKNLIVIIIFIFKKINNLNRHSLNIDLLKNDLINY